MLRFNKTKAIRKVGQAVSYDYEGLKSTSRLLYSHDDLSIYETIAEEYKNIGEEAKEEGKPALGAFKKIGFTVSLPYTLLLSFALRLGGDISTLIAVASKEKNIETLVKYGIIKQEDVPTIIDKIENLDMVSRVHSTEDVLYQMEGGMSR